MKKYIFLVFSVLFFSIAQSQNAADAMRFAQEGLSGTARFKSMSGAFGALGGDLSSINVNPAGTAILTSNQTTLTLGSYNTSNSSNYFGTTNKVYTSSPEINQFGVAFVWKSYDENDDWRKFVLSSNYELVNDYRSIVSVSGTNPQNSIANYFLSYANGVSLDVLKDQNSFRDMSYQEQQATLGYQGFVINPVADTGKNTQYSSNVPGGGNYNQENYVSSEGFNRKWSVNLATSYKDKLFFGINLNFFRSEYIQNSSFSESNDNHNPTSTNEEISETTFNNSLNTIGDGFSLQLGAIAKISESVRVGLGYESPVWYSFSDQLSQNIYSITIKNRANFSEQGYSPNIVSIFPDYSLNSPAKYNGSFAYIFKKRGLISIDYILKDYSSTKLTPRNDFKEVNNQLSSELGLSSELRVGAEYRIQAWSIRGGYRFVGSPYKNTSIIGDTSTKTIGDTKGFSTGLGYNFGFFKVDMAFSRSKTTSAQPFFSQGFTDAAKIDSKLTNVIATIVLNL